MRTIPPFPSGCLLQDSGFRIRDSCSGIPYNTLVDEPDIFNEAMRIAKVEYPELDVERVRAMLDDFGREGRAVVKSRGRRGVEQFNAYFFDTLGFHGNVEDYYDPRNSYLNDVIERRTGIPITLALIYMEVARRAGLPVEGVNFPGHFLLRCPARRGMPYAEDLIIDAFHGGALLSRELLQRRYESRSAFHDHLGDSSSIESRLLPHATKPQILARMLLNLKRVYVRMLSFPQARDITELLIAVDPSAHNELRDRGLLAYHLKDFPAALRDLQAYLQLTSSSRLDQEERQEHEQIWEHVKTLRKRVASLN